jgi:hypothetical protein
MCCRSNTLSPSFQTRAPGKVVPAPPAAKPATTARSGLSAPKFVYTGNTGLTVVSPITGKRYRFERTGAQTDVDPRDRSWMSFVPNLRSA